MKPSRSRGSWARWPPLEAPTSSPAFAAASSTYVFLPWSHSPDVLKTKSKRNLQQVEIEGTNGLVKIWLCFHSDRSGNCFFGMRPLLQSFNFLFLLKKLIDIKHLSLLVFQLPDCRPSPSCLTLLQLCWRTVKTKKAFRWSAGGPSVFNHHLWVYHWILLPLDGVSVLWDRAHFSPPRLLLFAFINESQTFKVRKQLIFPKLYSLVLQNSKNEVVDGLIYTCGRGDEREVHIKIIFRCDCNSHARRRPAAH